MELRDYQRAAVASVFNYFSQGGTGNPVLAMPTGTGKSLVLAKLMEITLRSWPDQRTIMLTHVKELISQNYETFCRIWPTAPAGVYSAGLNRRDHWAPITFAGIGSVAKRPELFGKINLAFVDECHLVSDKSNTMYQKFLGALKLVNPNLKVIGLSATPWRLGQGLITDGGLFTDFCYDITSMTEFNKLISDGWLCTLIPRKTEQQFDLSDVGIRMGEYVAGQLVSAVDQDRITYAALLEARALAADRGSWLVFAVSVEHAEKCAACLNAIGVSATCVHSKINATERASRLAAYKSGQIRAMVNNNVLTTGFDHPPLDCIVMLRPTASPGLWVQMLGRGTRPHPGKKNCLVLDFAGNTERLGPINDPVLPKRKGKGGGGSAPIRECPACHCYNHASVKICAACGYEFPERVRFSPGASTDQLVKDELPEINIFPVSRMTAQLHTKNDRPPSIRISYHCGIRRFSEFVCLEHKNYAGKRARDWWRTHLRGNVMLSGEIETPETTEEALKLIEHINCPTHIRVWTNKNYPEVMAHDFSDTAFGSRPKSEGSQQDTSRKKPDLIGATGRDASSPEMLHAMRPYEREWEDF
jgi:DNA repair protein RadD